MKDLELQNIELIDNAIWLNRREHIGNYAFIDKKLESDSEKIMVALQKLDNGLLAGAVYYVLEEDLDEETFDKLDLDDRKIGKLLCEILFNKNSDSNVELKKEIKKAILKLYENGNIMRIRQINNVLLCVQDDYEGKDFDSCKSYWEKCEILKDIYILDMYISFDSLQNIDLNKFNYEQIVEIHTGLKNWIDISKYADIKYTAEEMRTIRDELEDWGVDISKYVGVGFSEDQLYEIKEGLESGIDVSAYADTNIDSDKMFKIRRKLEKEKTN
ncbi:hypothetical protein ABDJ34_08255 [Finegoldia dalianensis]|uniref:Uncharacterized protein n=1 Tax=Finegoldia dalianensis TaxID=3145239 RepID=A0ABW9KDX5_9FIRM